MRSYKQILEDYEDGIYRARYLAEEQACLDVAIHIAATAGERGWSNPPRPVMHYVQDFTGITNRAFVREEFTDDVRPTS